MAEVIWTENALLGLRDIVEYIELFNPAAAAGLASSVFAATGRLEDHPLSCLMVDELPDMDFRQLLVGPVRLLYQYRDANVVILHSVRQERALTSVLTPD